MWFDALAGFGLVRGARGESCFVPWDAVERAGVIALEPATPVVVRVSGGTVVDLVVTAAKP